MMTWSSRPDGPAFWRRIKLHFFPGLVSAGLEDDFHRFRLHLGHAEGVITSVDAVADRFPYATCPGAGSFLAEQFVGKDVREAANLNPLVHCTHLYDLLVLSAGHTTDDEPLQIDLWVPDRNEERTSANLYENGELRLRWDVNGMEIDGPEGWQGRDLRKLSVWRQALSPADVERSYLLRRAVFLSGGRAFDLPPVKRAADRGPSRMGVCFTYQMPRAMEAWQSPEWRRDFSKSNIEPLQGFEPLLRPTAP